MTTNACHRPCFRSPSIFSLSFATLLAIASLAEAAPQGTFEFNSSIDAVSQADGPFPSGINSPPNTGNLAILLNRIVSGDQEGPGFDFDGTDSELEAAAEAEAVALIGEQLSDQFNEIIVITALTAIVLDVDLDSGVLRTFTSDFFDNAAGTSGVLRGGQVTNFVATDPFVSFEATIENPTDEAITFRLETQIEIDELDGFSLVTNGFFLAEVFDTDGVDGASLDFSLGFTARRASDRSETSAPPFASGIIGPGAPTIITENDETFFIGENVGDSFVASSIDAILGFAFLTLSPGDSARIQMIGNFGDATTPLQDLAAVQSSLDLVVETGNILQQQFAVPEPSSAALLLLGGLGLMPRRRNRARTFGQSSR